MQKPRRFLLLYASVTGKAESIAELLVEEATKRGLEVDLQGMEGYGEKYDLSKETVVVLVSSTTGDGDQPENAEPLWRKIKKKALPVDTFQHLNLAILGLGDTNYSQFCNGPKTLYQRFTELGAKSFYDPGWADDGVGLELVVEPWIEGLWPALERILDTQPTMQKGDTKVAVEATITNETQPESPKISRISQDTLDHLTKQLDGLTVNVHPLREAVPKDLKVQHLSLPSKPATYLTVATDKSVEASKIPNHMHNCHGKLPLSDSEAVSVPLLRGECLVAKSAKKRGYMVTLDLKDSGLNCLPGDALGFLCPNPAREVDVLLQRLSVAPEEADAPTVIQVAANATKKNAKVPDFLLEKGLSLRQIFTYYLDFRAVPKKPLLRILADSCSEESDKLPLLYLCSKSGAANYLKRVRAPGLGLLDLLMAFPSCQPPLDRLLEQIPRLLPRPLSLASEISSEGHADFVFNVVDIDATVGRMYPRRGICTGWLEDYVLNRSEKPVQVGVFSRSQKQFRYPESVSEHVIMIGPGTGVAPFRGFLQQRARMLKEDQFNKDSLGEAWLFFGCRKPEVDHLFKDEMQKHVDNGVLTKYLVAYSQDESDADIQYVQHLLRRHWTSISPKLSSSTFYVCGDAANMAKDVAEAVTECLRTHEAMTEAEARAKLADMMIQKKFRQDVWT